MISTVCGIVCIWESVSSSLGRRVSVWMAKRPKRLGRPVRFLSNLRYSGRSVGRGARSSSAAGICSAVRYLIMRCLKLYDSTSIRQPFDCLSEHWGYSDVTLASRSHADLFTYLGRTAAAHGDRPAILTQVVEWSYRAVIGYFSV